MSFNNNIVLAGATGNLGPALLDALLAASYTVTVLTRAGSNPTLPTAANLTVTPVDYTSPASLQAAIANHSAVIAALPMDAAGTAAQQALIDACLAAHVPRFVPSTFGSDLRVARAAALPAYAGKVALEARLAGLRGQLQWTSIACGPYLDWCIMVGLFLEAKARRVTYYDGGDVRFSTTTLAGVGRALARALEGEVWGQVEGRVVRVHESVVTQRALVAAAREVQKAAEGGGEWVEEEVDTAELERVARVNFEKGEVGFEEVYSCIKRAIWGEGYGGDMTGHVDNELLGIKELSEDDLKAIVARYC